MHSSSVLTDGSCKERENGMYAVGYLWAPDIAKVY